ncbi:LysR family transcriptional regulator [Aromatoleum toluolicum]|uniref:LysR family transcriptional regulator n=1 Tax=Aromatoleum toluolicum TaxID=90060 RepID=A0ABX1NCV0_9RHOO|nr:LysR family transcriptional regulator [Aromatoleum toluolicum]NMF97099.1 LysR family transcriptional regulator [Aromatoleum toluolicum]
MSWLASWETFVKVVESGSMAAAARRLDCTRAQVSKQIGELERRFGVRLFDRSTRKLFLTPSGEVFYQHALRALESVELTEVAVRNLGDVPSGLLRISASVVFGRIWLTPLLPRLTARYPELECELILTNTLIDLAEDRIDLALRFCKTPPEDVVAKRIFTMETVICAAPAYLARHGAPRQPRELVDHQCFSFLLSDNRIWHLLDHTGAEVAIPVRGRIQFNEPASILDATLAGHGLAILPTYLCCKELADGRLVRVLTDYTPRIDFGRHLYACYMPSRARLPKVKVLLDELEALLKPVPPWGRLSG